MPRKRRIGKPYLIVVDPRKTLTAKEADLFLQLKPGTNIPLLNGILHLILEDCRNLCPTSAISIRWLVYPRGSWAG